MKQKEVRSMAGARGWYVVALCMLHFMKRCSLHACIPQTHALPLTHNP